MADTDLKAVIFENVHKMLAMGLERAPFITEAKEPILLETWHEALTDSGFTDADARKIAKCWRAMRRTAVKWFTPAQLIQSVRSLHVQEQTALPNLSPQQIEENQKRLADMLSTLKLGAPK